MTLSLTAQEMRTKRVVVQDSVQLDSISINPYRFSVTQTNGTVIDSTAYRVDYGKSVLYLNKPILDTLVVTYRVYPEFLTKKYSALDPSIIVDNSNNLGRALSLGTQRRGRDRTPLSGLNTSGSIVRGITSGNNQNSTVNSELDLQISGKLSDKVTLRASIQDSNIPSQEGGYSQNLDEFDQIFIELYGENWKIRAGDIDLTNSDSYFAQFTKKIQGLAVGGTFNHTDDRSTEVYGAGALVRGVFNTSTFTGQEGNQGPYKITGPNGELFVLIVSGSEVVYVNGVVLERGENEDYVIDYNAGEIRFNPTYPITSEMRISIDYQFSERNFTRFVGYGGVRFRESERLQIAAYAYSESDAKNQELQQTLSPEQQQVLAAAGDDTDAMIASSAIPDTFGENKVLYRQVVIGGETVFEFSTDPEEELFTVRFSNVGPNQGNYVLNTVNTLQRTFTYVAPINGVPQGEFEPQVRLFAPTLLQLAGVSGSYTIKDHTRISAEISGSRNDQNLFSDLDDNDNTAMASHIEATHRLFGTDSTGSVSVFTNWDYIDEDYVNVEGLYNVEFNRDWGLDASFQNANGLSIGNQNFLTTGANYANQKLGTATYTYQNLDFSEVYTGRKHTVNVALGATLRKKDTAQNNKKITIRTAIDASTLNANDVFSTTDFTRARMRAALGYGTMWLGAKYAGENNRRRVKANDSLTPISQRFDMYEVTAGVGDSTQVFIEAGYRYRTNDSLRNNAITQVNTANTYFINTQLIKNENTKLSAYLNYRTLDYTDANINQEESFNSRLQYEQQFLKGGVRTNTLYETSSGTQPRQEFTYVSVDEGQGTHTWNDYNGNNVQELEEFELAQFQDQADFVRVLLPSQVFIKTHQNRFSQQLILNAQRWTGAVGLKKFLSHFYNQTSYAIDRRELRLGSTFNLNPFNESEDEIGLNLSFRNTLFFNRGKRRFTTSYSYIATRSKNLLSTGLQENELKSHQLNFIHKIRESWLFDFKTELGTNKSRLENFATRDFTLNTVSVAPKISYLFGLQSRVALTYAFAQKDNQIGGLEQLDQHDVGASFVIASGAKGSLTGGVNYVENRFRESVSGLTNAFSPVAYQMLEGLQPGTNFTWNLIAQKRLTKYLDLNLSYFGRKGGDVRTVHTGNVQLRAFF